MVNLHTGPYRIFSRIINVLRTEGLAGLPKRIKGYHAFVVAFRCGPIANPTTFTNELDPVSIRAFERAQRFLNSLEFKQLTMADIEEIDELTDIDPWKVPKLVTLEKLQEGWHCFVAKYKGQIVASNWTKAGPEFMEPVVERSITLADDEIYGWRTFCVSGFRGRGVHPWLNNAVRNHLYQTKGAKSIVGWVRTSNKVMLHTQLQMGGSVVGRLGYIQFFGVRLHYLWGRRALSATKTRCFIELLKNSYNTRKLL
jgi:hypothetical protein